MEIQDGNLSDKTEWKEVINKEMKQSRDTECGEKQWRKVVEKSSGETKLEVTG